MPPPYVPGRAPPTYDSRGNALTSSPNMAPPPWNPGGLNPSVAVQRGVESWTQRVSQSFVTVGGNQIWTYETPIFSCRPAVPAASGITSAGIPLNHEAALGQSYYLLVLVGSQGGVPPASLVGLRMYYTQYGNNITSDELYQLSQEQDCTDTMLAGGETTTGRLGASLIAINPVQPSLLFWQVGIRFTMVGLTNTGPLFLQLSVH